MGLFWDLIQQSQISSTQHRTDNLDSRVARLEQELDRTQQTLHELVMILEKHFGQDFDKDGQIG